MLLRLDSYGAITQFRDFLRQYPKSALADNAAVLARRGYYVTRDYDNDHCALSCSR